MHRWLKSEPLQAMTLALIHRPGGEGEDHVLPYGRLLSLDLLAEIVSADEFPNAILRQPSE